MSKRKTGFLGLNSKDKQMNLNETNTSGNISLGNDNSDINISQNNSHNKKIINMKGLINIVFGDKTEVTDDESLKVRINEIREMMDGNQTKQALKELEELKTTYLVSAKPLTVNDRFSIFMNIYTCYINLSEFENEKKLVETMIRNDLNTAAEYYKFKYLFALDQFKTDKANDIIPLCQEVLDEHEDYYKARILLLIAQSISQEIEYDVAITTIDELIKKHELKDSNKAYAIIAKGDISLNTKHFDSAIEYYSEAYSLKETLNYKAGVAIAYFLKAVKNANANGYIKFSKLDFDSLHEARVLFDEIYEVASKEKNTAILKEIIPFYMNALEFTEESQQILDIKKEVADIVDFEKREMAIISVHAEMLAGDVSQEAIDKLSGSDKAKLELYNLASKGKYSEVYTKILPLMDSVFKNDEAIIALYLISLIRTSNSDFVPELKRYKENFKGEVEYELIWIQYLEHSDKLEEAKDEVKRLIEKRDEPLAVLDAYMFYERHNMNQERFELSQMIVDGVKSVRPKDFNEVQKKHLFMLIDMKSFEEAEQFFNKIDLGTFGEIDKLQIQVEYHRFMGELQELADLTVEYAKKVQNNSHLIYGASLYSVTNQLSKGIRLLEEIRDSGNYEKSELYRALSKLYIMNNENDKAFDSALKAKEIDKDLFKSPSHSFFVMMGLRVNRTDDATKHMVEFHENFPKEDWIRSGNVLVKDEDGNDTIDPKELMKLTGDRTGYNEVRQAFFNYKFGVSTYMKVMNDMKLDFIFGELRYLKKKIKVSEGVVSKINQYAEVIENVILVDLISLYVLADADCLDILKEFEEVQISYTTYESLLSIIIQMESPKIRTILEFISNSMNVKLVAIKQSLMHGNRHFTDETMFNLHYSHSEKIPYLSGEYNLRNAITDNSEYVVDISSVLKALSLRNADTRKKTTKYIEKLIRQDYTFISFNLVNVIDTFDNLHEDDDINEAFSVYLSMSRFCDYDSFINIYIKFLHFIEDRIENDRYLEFVAMIFDYLDWYVGRTRYYHNLIKPNLPDKDEYPYYYREDALCTSVMVLGTKIDEHLWQKKYVRLKNDSTYIKYHSIVMGVMNGLYHFFLRYKDDEVKFVELYKLIVNRFRYIDSTAMKAMVSEMYKGEKNIENILRNF